MVILSGLQFEIWEFEGDQGLSSFQCSEFVLEYRRRGRRGEQKALVEVKSRGPNAA